MANADPISGEWEATLSASGQLQTLTFMLMLEGKQVSGRVESERGASPLDTGEFSQNRLQLSVPSEQGEMEFEGQLTDDKLVGEYSVAGGTRGTWEARKK